MKQLLVLFFFISPVFSIAQIFYNNGASIWTGPQSLIHINGGLENNSSSSNGDIEHHGTMWITRNSTFPNAGDVWLNNNSTLRGNGTYYVEQDWVNNANFIANNSTVELYGNLQQFITGTVITTFHNLTLTGTGTGSNRKKTQTLDARIDATGVLNLNDRELETQTHTMFVLNPSPAAVDNDSLIPGSEGFVSSIAPGFLHRETNSTSSYIFPVGSSNNSTPARYRPVRIRPIAATPTHYKVRFINYNADYDNFFRNQNDGVMCQAIDTFYHAIEPNAAVIIPADISIYYRSANDGGIWNGLAHWRNNNASSNPNMWNDMGNVTQSIINNFNVNTRYNWLFSHPGFPYLLTRLRPAPPQLICNDICANTSGTFYVIPGTGTYNWTVSGGTITNGQGTGTITVTWGSNNGVVSVVDSTNAFCVSLPSTCTVTALPVPMAGFDTSSTLPFNNPWTFTDTSTGAISWIWYFGDGNSSTMQNPVHQYATPGTYTVTQIVINQHGCVDTITAIVIVPAGIIIPNVFTPDGNGTNDVFYIPNSGVKEFFIEIYDRWGAKVWEARSDEIRWDGRSLSGKLLSDGVYYYVLKATLITETGEKVYDVAGHVTLLTENR